MVTKQKNIMLIFPLLDIFWCVPSSSEACSPNSKEPLFGHHCFYPPNLSPPLHPYLARGEEVVNAFQRFCRRQGDAKVKYFTTLH